MELGVLRRPPRPGAAGQLGGAASTSVHRFLLNVAVHLAAAVSLWSTSVRGEGYKQDLVRFCEGQTAADTTVVSGCSPGSRILPSSVTYKATRQFCPAAQGDAYGAEPVYCYGELEDAALRACVGVDLCRIDLPGMVACNGSSPYYLNNAVNSYFCAAGDSWHDACYQGPGSYSSERAFIYFGKSTSACRCSVSLLGSGDIEVIRRTSSSSGATTAADGSGVVVTNAPSGQPASTSAASEEDAGNTAAEDAELTAAPLPSSAAAQTPDMPRPSVLVLDECVSAVVSQAGTRPWTAVLQFTKAPACSSQYWLVYGLTGGSPDSKLNITCNTPEEYRPTQMPGTDTTKGAPNANATGNSSVPIRDVPGVSTAATASDSTVALAAGLTGGLVGAVIVITVLTTLVIRLRREKRPRRVPSQVSRKSASRQQSTMVISESDYNSRDEVNPYYETPLDRRGTVALSATAATDYQNGYYLEVLRDDRDHGTAALPGSQQQPRGSSVSAPAQYEVPMTYNESLESAFYESLKSEPSTQL